MAGPLCRSISTAPGGSWRASDSFFRPGAELRGAINLSPAWFQQGRNVGKISNLSKVVVNRNDFEQSTDFEPEVSALLKTGRDSLHTRGWLSAMKDHAALLTACLAIMHPDMYLAGREAMLKLGKWTEDNEQADMSSILPIWPSVFSVVSVMVNRMSPLHTDMNGRPQLFDLLVTVGDYEDLDIVIPTICRSFRYAPGTAIAFSGRMLQHGVRQIGDNRAVLSFYMRDNVHQFVDVARSNYMEYSKVGLRCI